MSYYLKDPGSTIDFAIDWSPWLAGGAIGASEWTIIPAEAGGLTRASDGFAPTRTVVTVDGGVRGRVYRLMNRVTLSDGRRDERTLSVRVEER